MIAVPLIMTMAVVALPRLVRTTDQPPLIQALIAHFGGAGHLPRPAPPTFPPRLGDLVLIGADQGLVGDVALRAHRYQGRDGAEIVVYQADRSFPPAAGARPHPSGATWEARVGALVLYCAERRSTPW